MADSIFRYDKLENPRDDIRLLTLLPGAFDDKLRLTIKHIKLVKTRQFPPRSSSQRKDIKRRLPDDWDVFECLNDRFLYVHTERGGAKSAYWTHPAPEYATDATGELGTTSKSSEKPTLSFEALSYIWGAEENPIDVLIKMAASPEDEDVGEVLIQIPGTENSSQYCTMSVRRNLEGSLRHLRYKDKSRRLWVDAICINQADIHERGEQVARMKDIFQLADRVIIWIGSATDDSQLAMQTLGYLGQQVVAFKDRTRGVSPEAQEKTWHQPSIVLPYDSKIWISLRNLLERPWFRRLWVVQEAHLAREGLFLCGEDEIDWLDFRYAIIALLYHNAIIAYRKSNQSISSSPQRNNPLRRR